MRIKIQECSKSFFYSASDSDGTLIIKVLGIYGIPQESVYIITIPYVWGQHGYTNSSGIFHITLPANEYKVVAVFDGGNTRLGYLLVKNVTLLPSQTMEVLFDLRSDAELTVVFNVKTYRGIGLANAKISMFYLGMENVDELQADVTGQKVVRCTKGIYDVLISGSNHLYVIRGLLLSSDLNINVGPPDIQLSKVQLRFYTGKWNRVEGGLLIWAKGWDVWQFSSSEDAYITPGFYFVGPMFGYLGWSYTIFGQLNASGPDASFEAGGSVKLHDSLRFLDKDKIEITLVVYDSFGNAFQSIGNSTAGWWAGRPWIQIFYPNGSLLTSGNFSTWELSGKYVENRFVFAIPPNAPRESYKYTIYLNTGPYQGIVNTKGTLATPRVSFTSNLKIAWISETIAFDASDTYSANNITSFVWNFGDGTTIITASPLINHVYKMQGNYIITLKVTDGKGLSNSTKKTITVTFRTDLNKDGTVNIMDITSVATAYNSHGPDIPNPGDPPSKNWNEIADLDKNGAVNILDVTIIAKDYGKIV
jgi:hypothetical protein